MQRTVEGNLVIYILLLPLLQQFYQDGTLGCIGGWDGGNETYTNCDGVTTFEIKWKMDLGNARARM
jgi:hypothetical protein